MIKVSRKRIEVNGTAPDLLTELSMIIKALKENGIKEEEIRDAIEIGLAIDDVEKIMKKIKEKINELLKDMGD